MCQESGSFSFHYGIYYSAIELRTSAKRFHGVTRFIIFCQAVYKLLQIGEQLLVGITLFYAHTKLNNQLTVCVERLAWATGHDSTQAVLHLYLSARHLELRLTSESSYAPSGATKPELPQLFRVDSKVLNTVNRQVTARPVFWNY